MMEFGCAKFHEINEGDKMVFVLLELSLARHDSKARRSHLGLHDMDEAY